LTVWVSAEDWKVLWSDQQLDASWDARFSADETGVLESEDHLMDGWRGDAEVPLHVGFGGRLSEDAFIGIDEGQILTLLLGEDWSRRSHAPNN
jgi:hypothetical protein